MIDATDIVVIPSTPIVNVIEALKTSALGIAVLNYYKSNRNLTEEHRNDLVDIIIGIEVRTNNLLK